MISSGGLVFFSAGAGGFGVGSEEEFSLMIGGLFGEFEVFAFQVSKSFFTFCGFNVKRF